MAKFIYNWTTHDWSSETTIFQTTMQNEFGANWKKDVAEIVSWRGLEGTQEFHNWYISSGYTTGTDKNDNTTYPAVSTIIGTMKKMGNQNCN